MFYLLLTMPGKVGRTTSKSNCARMPVPPQRKEKDTKLIISENVSMFSTSSLSFIFISTSLISSRGNRIGPLCVSALTKVSFCPLQLYVCLSWQKDYWATVLCVTRCGQCIDIGAFSLAECVYYASFVSNLQ